MNDDTWNWEGSRGRRALRDLRSELDHDLAGATDLAAVDARRLDVEELVADLDRQLARVRSAAVITLVGATGAGKSTLLNALVGRAVAVEGETRPTTRAPVVYRPLDAGVRELLDGLPGEAPVVVDYDPGPGGPWQEQILIDAPDINSVADLHREVVRMLAGRSDVLVVVLHRQSASEQASVEFVDVFAGRRGMIFVLNRADELTDHAREELVAQVRRLARERWQAPEAPVIALSARAAQTRPNTPGWAELTSELQGLVNSGILGRVRRHNCIGTVARLARVFGAARDEGAATFDELAEALPAGLSAWTSHVTAEVRERLDLRRAGIKELLWAEAARHWDGPGGWALRAGGLGALGLGAGAVLARRNPLLAAGAAAGALAADRVKGALRERRLSDASALSPAHGESEAWYREDLGRARLLAARLCGAPTALGVPGLEELQVDAHEAIEDVWSRFVERDLPAEARAGARWFVRWPVDLPVYAFCGWIVWSAAKGFYHGEFAGLDFLVNALLLLLAWLFVARSLVRAGLSAKSRSMVAALRSRLENALSEAAARRAETAEARWRASREALDRLADAEARWRSRLEG